MPENEPPEDEPDGPRGPVGIYFGKGSRNGLTDSNTIVGYENPLADHGSGNQHFRNRIYRTRDDMGGNDKPKPPMQPQDPSPNREPMTKDQERSAPAPRRDNAPHPMRETKPQSS